jgi:SAM-dependent methyltransferase
MRYLAAKRTVDDRALNQIVWNHLANAVQAMQRTRQRPLRVLELGAGIGTMVERMLAWRLFDADTAGVRYTLLDADPALLQTARGRLSDHPAWLELDFSSANVLDYAANAVDAASPASFDLLIANAFLDLLDLRTALPRIRTLLADGGIFYFTITFDGATLLEPTLDPALDAAIEMAYHRTMDTRITDDRPSGDSRTGRHLFTHLPASGFEIQSAGSSDWVIFPIDGAYPADEAYFLQFIVETMHNALRTNPALDAGRFGEWVAARQAQIKRAELVYIAHQLDFCGVARSQRKEQDGL